MPTRKSGHTTAAFWVTPDSDVTHKMKTVTNAGSSVAAGVVLGAWRRVRQVIQTPQSGSVASVEAGREPGRFVAARQSQIVRVLTGGAGRNTTTKGLTGSMKLSKRCAAQGVFPLGGPWKGASGYG